MSHYYYHVKIIVPMFEKNIELDLTMGRPADVINYVNNYLVTNCPNWKSFKIRQCRFGGFDPVSNELINLDKEISL